jgi:hypothetical protein
MAPPAVSNTPFGAPHFGTCGQRFNAAEEARNASRQRERVEREQAAARQRDTAAARSLSEARSRILASTDPTVISHLLAAHAGALSMVDCKQIWKRLLTITNIPATHEMVKLEGKPTAGGFVAGRGGLYAQRGSWREVGPRLPLWMACVRDGSDVVLDSAGTLLRAGSNVTLMLKNKETQRAILVKGARVALKRHRGTLGSAWRVDNSWWPEGCADDPASYALAVAAVAATPS